MWKLVGFYLFLVFGCVINQSCLQQNTQQTSKPTTAKRTFEKTVFNLKTVEELQNLLTYEEQGYPLVSAHRGGSQANYPENAIETFENIASQAAVIIECDVRLTRDSVMVLMHDEKIDRTTNGKGYIGDMTRSELKEFRLKDSDGKLTNFQIPTLEEALIWGKGRVLFSLDVKKDVSYQELNKLILASQAESYVIVITNNARQATAVNRTNPNLMISVPIKSEKDLNRLTTAGIPDNKLVAFVGTQQPDTALVNILHQHGITIILATMGNLDKRAEKRGYQVYAEYIEKGADIISTDRPFEAQKALDFYIRKRDITSPYIND